MLVFEEVASIPGVSGDWHKLRIVNYKGQPEMQELSRVTPPTVVIVVTKMRPRLSAHRDVAPCLSSSTGLPSRVFVREVGSKDGIDARQEGHGYVNEMCHVILLLHSTARCMQCNSARLRSQSAMLLSVGGPAFIACTMGYLCP